ncbi:hypothetical protein HYPGJ_31017 [Hyphomicrobium sp. GJ21]|uniref:type IV toxin-antitoxin system AbiEi family antitoxin domain-containing protein n=1 Tax=Hyphomicrobium sp. GJ21 TaxID=113574 RepID=UPI000622BDF5|nr:hypothetical protein [Hyphomicrobium sp. GJ21]CEJ87249.1 hypothetical protein HYPGJ_31017 [Hyphomicrobium sp. GJ21]
MLTIEQFSAKYSTTSVRPPIVLDSDRQWALGRYPPWLPHDLIGGDDDPFEELVDEDVSCDLTASRRQRSWAGVIADLASEFESHYNGQLKTYDEWSRLWRMTWMPKIDIHKLYPKFAPKQPPHPFFRSGSRAFERALAVASPDEERMWRRFGVAQLTPDDPRLADVEGDEGVDIKQRVLRFAAYRYPDGIVCLTTALFIHDLTERYSPDIWMWGTEPPTDTRGLSLFTTDPKVFATGHAPYLLDGGDVSVRVTTPARSIVDCFSWHERVGLKVAEAALRKAILQGIVTPDDVTRVASDREVAAPLVTAALSKLKRSRK